VEKVEVREIGLIGDSGNRTRKVSQSDILTVFCDFRLKEDVENLHFVASIIDENQSANLIRVMSDNQNVESLEKVISGDYRLRLTIPNHHLTSGNYFIHLTISNRQTGEKYSRVLTNSPFQIASTDTKYETGFISVEEEWGLELLANSNDIVE
jgi:hypothetical protein